MHPNMLFASSDILLMICYAIVMLSLGLPGDAQHVSQATQQVHTANELFLTPKCFENLLLTLVCSAPRAAMCIPSSAELGRKVKNLHRDAKLERSWYLTVLYNTKKKVINEQLK